MPARRRRPARRPCGPSRTRSSGSSGSGYRAFSQQASLLRACRGQERRAMPARGRPGGVREGGVRGGGGDYAPGGGGGRRGAGGVGAAARGAGGGQIGAAEGREWVGTVGRHAGVV